MSSFIGNLPICVNILGQPGLSRNDESLQPIDYRFSPQYHRSTLVAAQTADYLWPRSSFFGNDLVNIAGINENVNHMWEYDTTPLGKHRRKLVTGQVLNSSNVAVAGATVYLFNTASGLLVDTATSDSLGNYSLGDPNNVACFVIAYLPGSPDTAGTTINTLTGS